MCLNNNRLNENILFCNSDFDLELHVSKKSLSRVIDKNQ